MFGWDFWISLLVAVASLGVNLMQWIRHRIARGGFWQIMVAVEQLRARCVDAHEQGIIGLSPGDKDFVNSMGHGLRGIERQIEDILGMTLAEHERRRGRGGLWRRFMRRLLPPTSPDRDSASRHVLGDGHK